MKKKIQVLLFLSFFCMLCSAFMPAKDKFTAAEQQQISIATPGLFARSNAFQINLSDIGKDDFSFPLPVGKATLTDDHQTLEIATKEGDVVKAMLNGTVRLAKTMGTNGNTIVIRHDNGLETVYANNAQNLVKVGDKVQAGQSIAIVGTDNTSTKSKKKGLCRFFIMINGGKINPDVVLEIRGHRLRKKTLVCTKNGKYVDVALAETKNKPEKEVLS